MEDSAETACRNASLGTITMDQRAHIKRRDVWDNNKWYGPKTKGETAGLRVTQVNSRYGGIAYLTNTRVPIADVRFML